MPCRAVRSAFAFALVACGVAAGVACGTLESSTAPDAGAPDGAPADGSNPGDAAADAPLSPCAIVAFGSFRPLDELNDPDASTSTPRLSPDELHIYFESTRTTHDPKDNDLWSASRTSRELPFGNVTRLTDISATGGNDVGATVSANGLDIFFTSNTQGTAERIVHATRTDPGASFESPGEVFPPNNQAMEDVFLVDKPRGLWLSSRELDSGLHSRLQYARASDMGDGFDTPAPVVTGFDPAHNDRFPVVSADGTELFVSDADQDGHARLFTAQRPSGAGPFGGLTEVTDFDKPSRPLALYAGWISPDHCTLYLSRSRGADPTGPFDIVVAECPR